MQETIKEVINIHKCKFFLKKKLYELAARPAGLCGPSPRGHVGSLSWPAPRFFCGPAGRARGPDPNCHPYT